MKNKFKFLTRDSISKKINTKSFKIINLILCIIIVALLNLDTVIKFFGGNFEELVNIYVIDESGIYEEFNEIMQESYLDVLDNYNAKVSLSDKTLEELKSDIISEEKSDIIIKISDVENVTYEEVFDVSIISYEFIDTLLYQNIINALNTTKENIALKNANIDEEVLDSIYKDVEVERVLLNEYLNENEELIEQIGGVIIIVFILPFFLLIVLIVQMIGAEINEEKTSKSMEVIISSVSPEVHFISKLISSNVFAIVQGILLVIYAFIGGIIRILTSGGLTQATTEIINSTGDISSISEYIKIFIESDMASRLVTGIPFFIILIILSFIAYSLFIGVLASITTSMEDYNQIQTPVMVFLMLGYYLAIYASVFQGSTFINIMAYVPFISGILAPVIYILGEMTLLGLIISIVLLIITCLSLYKYGLKVYKVGILNYSSSKLWTKIYKALRSK